MTEENNLFSLIEERHHTPVNRVEFQRKYGRSRHAIRHLKATHDLEGHKGCVNTINFNASGDRIITGSDDGTVKIWSTATRDCLQTLRGHNTNVFAANFLYHLDQFVVSGGNDSDVRFYDTTTEVATVYQHHKNKVLRISTSSFHPHVFMSCSADGTVRQFDIRQSYANSRQHAFSDAVVTERILPQGYGGGRAGASQADDHGSLILNYKLAPWSHERGHSLYSVDCHPTDEHLFLVASQDGNVRLFDRRKIIGHSCDSYVNIYRNIDLSMGPRIEATGAVFSRDGTKIACTLLCDNVYVFDTYVNFEQKYNLDYMAVRSPTDVSAGREYARRVAQRSRVEKPIDPASQHLPGSLVALVGIAQYLTAHDFFLPLDTDTDADVGVTATTADPVAEGEKADNAATTQDSDAPLRRRRRVSKCSEDEEEIKLPIPQTYRQVFRGHSSEQTIKACNFCGPDSEYVISGSDNARVFIWDGDSGEVETVLSGHQSVVNCVIPHPYDPLIATSGIDCVVKIWEPYEGPAYESIEQRQDDEDGVDVGGIPCARGQQ
eukprot:TRINITY_DN2803_c0_g2_i1.p1 TRINITY_DN2803_c0_g2~~TRINITY_DN2803_c0_g2_i1.p1  ORF type:complete len:548 (+),score=82.56 TRINITY_DN2803_c0_g2_i1:204-1847(+)